MSVDYKKLLPSVLRSTRWGQFIQAYQSLDEEIKTNSEDRIIKQFIYEDMTYDEMQNYCAFLGFDLTISFGYSSSDIYLQRQLSTITKRIKCKTTYRSYQYLFYIYNFLGCVFPMARKLTGLLEPYNNWWTYDEQFLFISTLDSGDDNISFYLSNYFDKGNTFDSGNIFDKKIPVYANPKESLVDNTTLDAEDLYELDQEDQLDQFTRYVLICYNPLFIENETEFVSTYTLTALENDIKQNKRKTEVPILEHILQLYYNSDGSIYTTTYTSYDSVYTNSQKSILITSSDLEILDIYRIRFGNSTHTTIDNTITDVNSYIFQLYNSEITDITDTEGLKIRKNFIEFYKMENSFSEIAILDIDDNCLFYSSFPTINFPNNFYSNIRIEFFNN